MGGLRPVRARHAAAAARGPRAGHRRRSTTLASWTPRPEVDRALDLGTGCGVQALHLGSHVRHITATDISERALAYARFNALLNGVQWNSVRGPCSIRCGRAFRTHRQQPPFVITPRGAGVPCSSTATAARRGTPSSPTSSAPSATTSSPAGSRSSSTTGRSSATPTGGNGCAAGCRAPGWTRGWCSATCRTRRSTPRPGPGTAVTTVRPRSSPPCMPRGSTTSPPAASPRSASSVITLQRPATRREPFIDLEEAEGRVAAPMGPAVLAGVRARTWLVEHSDDDLLAVAWRCAPDVTEERHGLPGAEDPSIILLRQGGGLGRAVRLTTAMAALASVCDGDLTARQALAAIASLLDVSDDEPRLGGAGDPGAGRGRAAGPRRVAGPRRDRYPSRDPPAAKFGEAADRRSPSLWGDARPPGP